MSKKIDEKEIMEEDHNDEDLFSTENEPVKIYDTKIIEQKAYKESKINRVYRRRDDRKVYITYENRRSRYSEGRNW